MLGHPIYMKKLNQLKMQFVSVVFCVYFTIMVLGSACSEYDRNINKNVCVFIIRSE